MKHCGLFGILLGICCGALAGGNHLEIMVPDAVNSGLKGPIQWVEEEKSFNVDGEFTKVREEYDRVGNLMVETNWDTDGDLSSTTTNLYDESGTYYSQVYIKHGKRGYTNHWDVVLSPETHQVAEKKESGAIVLKTYSPEKQLILLRYLKADKKQSYAKQWKWDQQQRLSRFVRLNAENKPEYTYTYRHNEQDEIDKSHVVYHEDRRERLHEYEYLDFDEYGNWTQRMMVRYDVTGKKKEKVYDRIQVREFGYHETNDPDDLAEEEA